MKLYLRRQTLASKTLIMRNTEISFSLYARLDLDPTERALVEEFALGSEILGSHIGLIPGYKKVEKDNLMTYSYIAAEIIPGKDISCISFVNMMGLEGSLLEGAKTYAVVLEHAREVKQNHEAVHDLSLAA